jgi:hypothetical protein
LEKTTSLLRDVFTDQEFETSPLMRLMLGLGPLSRKNELGEETVGMELHREHQRRNCRRMAGHVISVLDHGYLYGDGVFEGNADLRVVKIFKLEEHLHRLYESAKVLMMGIPWS